MSRRNKKNKNKYSKKPKEKYQYIETYSNSKQVHELAYKVFGSLYYSPVDNWYFHISAIYL